MTDNLSTKPTSTIPPDDPSRKLTLVGLDEDAKLKHVALAGDIYTLLLTGEDTANKFCLIDMQIPPGGGPVPHRHDFEETFSVLEGEVVVTFRGEKVTVRAGETANIPATPRTSSIITRTRWPTSSARARRPDRTRSSSLSGRRFRAGIRSRRCSTTLRKPRSERKPRRWPRNLRRSSCDPVRDDAGSGVRGSFA
jgi:mannose-6-phosphate isomerase-like protein (cupin superfamily)